jgi:hypothetical protein
MFYQDGLTGSAWGDWANYADSPLRAFEDLLRNGMSSIYGNAVSVDDMTMIWRWQ